MDGSGTRFDDSLLLDRAQLVSSRCSWSSQDAGASGGQQAGCGARSSLLQLPRCRNAQRTAGRLVVNLGSQHASPDWRGGDDAAGDRKDCYLPFAGLDGAPTNGEELFGSSPSRIRSRSFGSRSDCRDAGRRSAPAVWLAPNCSPDFVNGRNTHSKGCANDGKTPPGFGLAANNDETEHAEVSEAKSLGQRSIGSSRCNEGAEAHSRQHDHRLLGYTDAEPNGRQHLIKELRIQVFGVA
jgi:hypothetical protein